MLRFLNKVIRAFLPEQKIWNVKNNHNIPSMEWSLSNIRKLGFTPHIAIDVGAFDGEWTRMFKKIYPTCKILMIEAQKEKEAHLKKLACEYPDAEVYIGLLGAERGRQVTFHVNSTVSSVLKEFKENLFKPEIRHEELLDDVFQSKYERETPDFLKLDVQGYELEILKGASQLMKHVQFILCEVSLLEINQGCPLIAEVFRFMEENNFIPYDICSFIRRPLDRALWQTDILFIKKSHALLANKHWS